MTHAEQLARAEGLRNAGETRSALAAYREALRLGADGTAVRFQLGALHASLGEHGQALAVLREALAASPTQPDLLCLVGNVLCDLRRPREAVDVLESALRARPAFAEAYFNLGLARFELGELEASAQSFEHCRAVNRGPRWSAERLRQPEIVPLAPAYAAVEMATNPVKLRHDAEQIAHLMAQGVLSAAWQTVSQEYAELAVAMDGLATDTLASFDASRYALVARTYKQPLHLCAATAVSPLINPLLDRAAIEARFAEATPQVLALDGLLTAEALAAVRRFCLESTIWNNIKPGYLGAYLHDGFASELLLRLASELRDAFPRIFRGLPLQTMWGYKYDAGPSGISVHADAAAVNVNLWITPDEANLDPEGGGLLVFAEDAPPDWGFAKFNHRPGIIREYLDRVGARPQRIAHRANRAAIFDSDLFHATDQLRFRPGYLNRRINVTLLYGLRTMTAAA